VPAPSRKPTLAPVLGPAQGLGVVRPRRMEPVRLPGALEVPIADIAPDPKQPRRNWDHDAGEQRLADLADSIAEFGVLQPLLIRPSLGSEEGAPYRLVAGNRRLEAAKRAGLVAVPVVVRETNAVELRILQLTENLLRQDLAPLDEARAFQELMDLDQLSPRGLASRLHISDQQVRLRLRLLGDQVLADAVERRQIAANTARLIQQLPDEEQFAFRDRVRLGERLQANDMAAVRARLLAEGAIHPRRTRPPTPRTSDSELGAAEPDTSGDTRIDPSATRPLADVTEVVEVNVSNAESGGQILFDPPQKGSVGISSSVAGPEGGQRRFDPSPSAAFEQMLPNIAALLAAAAPETRLLVGRVVRTGHAHYIDPAALRDGLLLLAKLLEVLARHEPGAAALLALLASADDE